MYSVSPAIENINISVVCGTELVGVTHTFQRKPLHPQNLKWPHYSFHIKYKNFY